MTNEQHDSASMNVNFRLREIQLDRNISTLKSMLFVLLVLSLSWVVLAFTIQNEIIIAHACATFILILTSFLVHISKKHLLARALFVLFSHLILFSGVVMIGDSGRIDLITTAGFGTIFLLFSHTWEKPWIVGCIIICFTNLIAQWLWGFWEVQPLVSIGTEQEQLIQGMAFITVLSVLSVIMYKSMIVISKSELAISDLVETKIQLSETEKMASLGQLTAGVAHELNNPINAINGSITGVERKMQVVYELLDEYDKLNANAKHSLFSKKMKRLKSELESKETRKLLFEVIEDIKVGSERIVNIVSGLKKFSRIESKEKKSLNLHEGIYETLMLLRNIIKPTTQVNTHFDSKIKHINCYGYELNQVIMNLIINADQAIEEEGTIDIKTEDIGSSITISVKDNGRGMSKETMRKIFTPFFTTKPIGKGTGLGLSISYGIIDKHGGVIKVNSEVGVGSEFRIVLPKSA